jgi:acetylornithine deacetylase/succinyl-diaminopimelate desuccinylase-like protein
MHKTFYLLICLFATNTVFSQTANSQIRKYVTSNRSSLLAEYVQFVSIPNVTTDTANIQENTIFIQKMLRQHGITAELLTGTTPKMNPVVFGEVKVPGAKKTIAFYAHYDGQPVNPKQWATGLTPFKPVFIDKPMESGGKIVSTGMGESANPEWRMTGRGSADDKAGVMCIINAYAALRATGTKLKHNIKFFFEGEEEAGSVHLDEVFSRHKEKLKADIWIIADGPRHVSGKKLVQFGVRGDVNVHLTVYGPKRPLHSGNYGNWAPNPAMQLVQLLATMKDDKGNVLVKGFYNDVIPLSASEKAAIAKVPNIEATLKEELGISAPDGDGKSFLELLHLPTLNINGINSANTGQLAANVIPATAEATLDLRLVAGNDVDRQIAKVVSHIKEKGYYVLDREPTQAERMQHGKIIKITRGKGYNAQRTPMDLPIAQNVVKAVQSTSTDPIVLLPSAGGSLPLYLFEKTLNANVITVPVVNYDNNQHAENENVKVSFLWEGIETMAAVMIME